MARRDISMTADEVEAFLAGGRDLQVATLGKDGWPHLTTLWYVVIDGLVTFRSFTKSQRIVNLRRDPRLTVLVEAGETYGELRGVTIQATARLDENPDAVMDMYGRLAHKYGMAGPDPTPELIEAMFRRFATKNTVVTVEPAKVVSWDHRKE